ncbi:ANTAR domain-containing protein [Mycolicibacterium brisbanense]|uniref:ANTAR domain protein n=1 Tax=Mycolicibacterium brisbanense TaxID=146020 RepID=A0A100VW93_9MYCO|nr:ANTAR domain-containing protein [Mycolicibacterium brisbanense]MCV7161538.1 ANTAR domain-containing protein [Mycolicibacterium brisbanense]GAS87174.1 ANTAR domain protein [Mycolicibacterium brisbanense]
MRNFNEHTWGLSTSAISMNLFTVEPAELDSDTTAGAQALTDVAGIALLHQRAIGQRELLVTQLQGVLNDRLTIEQAKGVAAEQADISVGRAFALIRDYAHRRHLTLTDVAKRVVRHDLTIADLTSDIGATEP